MEVDGTGGPSCLTEASANTQGAANALRDRKPDLQSRLNHVRCALSSLRAKARACCAACPVCVAPRAAVSEVVFHAAQAQHEAQRLTQALHEEKQRADVAEARADKLVSWPLRLHSLPFWRARARAERSCHLAAPQEDMYNRLKHKYTSLKRSIREISG